MRRAVNLNPHNKPNIITGLTRQTIHPVGSATSIKSLLQRAGASVIGRERLRIVSAIVLRVASHQVRSCIQCLVGVQGIGVSQTAGACPSMVGATLVVALSPVDTLAPVVALEPCGHPGPCGRPGANAGNRGKLVGSPLPLLNPIRP